MTVFFTADTHFGHGAARSFYRRPFATTAEMDAEMLTRWNATVGLRDTVWHLGDFALRLPPTAAATLLDRLHGEKHLIVGNNDPKEPLSGWTSVQAYAELEEADTKLVLCHYPFRTWNNIARGAVNLHGHSHGRLQPLRRQIDVGVDVWDFRPVTLRDIVTRRASPGARPGRASAAVPS